MSDLTDRLRETGSADDVMEAADLIDRIYNDTNPEDLPPHPADEDTLTYAEGWQDACRHIHLLIKEWHR